MVVKQFRELDHVIDLSEEEPMSLHQAAQVLRKSHPTVFRYATSGIGGVRLPTVKLGKQRLTSLSSIQYFLDQLASQQR